MSDADVVEASDALRRVPAVKVGATELTCAQAGIAEERERIAKMIDARIACIEDMSDCAPVVGDRAVVAELKDVARRIRSRGADAAVTKAAEPPR